jgi:hypothetical protein
LSTMRKHLLLVVEQEAYPPSLRVEQLEGEGTPGETQGPDMGSRASPRRSQAKDGYGQATTPKPWLLYRKPGESDWYASRGLYLSFRSLRERWKSAMVNPYDIRSDHRPQGCCCTKGA